MRTLIAILLCCYPSLIFSQIKLDITSIDIDYNIYDKHSCADETANILFSSPRIRCELKITNYNKDTIKIATRVIMPSKLTYKYNNKLEVINDGMLFSPDSLPITIKIPHNESYTFDLGFSFHSDKEFDVENYNKNIWQILSTLQVEVQLDIPHGLRVESEPINWKHIIIRGE